jgi:YVTN family beta-propeller protein
MRCTRSTAAVLLLAGTLLGPAGHALAQTPAPTPTPVPLRPIPADTTEVGLIRIPIPPIQGQTASIDILDIDQATHRLYVADRTDTGIDVFDVSTPVAQYVTTIDVGSGPNGVVVAKNVNKLYAGLNSSEVVAIDLNPASPTYYQVIARQATGGSKRADEIDYDPVDRKVYAANSDDGIVSVVDARTDQIVAQFTDLGPGLEQPRYNPRDGLMYMTSSEQNALFQFDPRSDTLLQVFDVGDRCNPNGLAINPATNQALLGCSSRANPQHVAVWDLNTNQVVATFPQTGAGDAVIYDPVADRFFFGATNFNRGGMMSLFLGSPVDFITNVPTAQGSHGVAYDETNRVIYTQDQLPNEGALFAIPVPAVAGISAAPGVPSGSK